LFVTWFLLTFPWLFPYLLFLWCSHVVGLGMGAKISASSIFFFFFFSGRCFSARFFFLLLLLLLQLSLPSLPVCARTASLRCAHDFRFSLPLHPLWCSQMRFASLLLLACLLISLHLPLNFFAAGRKRETEREANTQRPRERFQSLVAGAQFDVRQDTGV